ncbi:helix-turn-helix domain-containing protein [Brevundimonas naejangsanensis]|jgi:Ner family transcriptional regulator|uniref:helix-turn-helix domain-containing protein n=1 Tax=Brevundimonas naejangsanensis TaxID=588932 RepID=UPI0026EF1D9B|nr:helix-turn-helix domain-containing protein [Brevundimonas naejangsanensis]
MIDEPNHHWIRTALKKRGLSMTDIARRLDVTPTTVCMVSRGAGRSRRVEQAIADAIGFGPHEIWPERYAEREVVMPSP